jgi:SAM-dependent methyltransferase
VVLVDVSARMVELATTRLVPHPESRIVCQDVGRFLADERTVYATVTAVGELLAHLPDPQSFLCRVAALMPPGGLFLMSFMDAAAMRTWEGTRVAAEVGTSSLLLEERCDLDAGSLHCRADEGRFVESWALRAGLTALRRSPAGHTRSGRLFRRT